MMMLIFAVTLTQNPWVFLSSFSRGILLVSEFRKYLKFEFNRPHFEGEEMNFSIPT